MAPRTARTPTPATPPPCSVLHRRRLVRRASRASSVVSPIKCIFVLCVCETCRVSCVSPIYTDWFVVFDSERTRWDKTQERSKKPFLSRISRALAQRALLAGLGFHVYTLCTYFQFSSVYDNKHISCTTPIYIINY